MKRLAAVSCYVALRVMLCGVLALCALLALPALLHVERFFHICPYVFRCVGDNLRASHIEMCVFSLMLTCHLFRAYAREKKT